MIPWQPIADRWLGSKIVAGIHLHWVSAQQCSYTLCVLEKRKQIISVVTKKSDISNLENLVGYLAPEVPIHLTIEGKGVLVRKVADHTENYLQQIIPNARSEDFHTIQHPHQFVSIVRRDAIDQAVAALSGHGLFVLSVSMSYFTLNTLIPFLTNEITSLNLHGQQLTITAGQISGINSLVGDDEPEVRYAIGDEQVHTRYLIAYASALTHFVPNSSSLLQEAGQQEFRHRQVFTKALPVLLVFFLVLLLVNTVVYVNAYQNNQELTQQASSSAVVLTRLTTLQQEVTDKERFLNTLGWERPDSKVSLADRLAATVPAQIVLSDLQISPLDEARLKKEKKQVFNSQIIRVSGQSEDILVLNEWLSELEAQDWVHRLEHQQYINNQEEKLGTFSFTLRLQP